MIVPINTTEESLLGLVSVLECSVGSLPFTHLGMPLGLKKPSVTDLLPLAKKCEKRVLVTANLLSQGGKLVLVNSILSSYPTFLMGLLKVHKTVVKQLHKFFSKEDLPLVQLIWNSYYTNGKLPGFTQKGSF
jgi:hypothetical protein